MSVLFLAALVNASGHGPLLILFVLLAGLPVLGMAGGARIRMPVRDLALYVAISIFLVVCIVVGAVWIMQK